MNRDDNKQVEDALDAIKKLVELSENKLGQDETVLTLDHVVWRNPVSDAPEEVDTSPKSPVADTKPSRPSFVSVSSHDLNEEPVTVDKIVSSPHKADPEGQIEVQQLGDDTVDLTALPTPSKFATSTTNTAPSTAELDNDKAEAVRQRMSLELAQASEDIKELTAPLGRRGGGFYSTPQQDEDRQIAIKTSSEPAQDAYVTAQESDKNTPIIASSQTPPGQSQPLQTERQVSEAVHQKAEDIEPALTDFQGADFNFSVAEGLMTAADFENLEQTIPEIKPHIEVPIAPPAVANPVDEVHQRLQQAQHGIDKPVGEDIPELTEDSQSTPMGQPNLHVVSDQTAFENDDEDEGFSGDVRLALRALIKEQVSTWLQGNMTGLIEEALSTPNKRGAQNSKPKTTKR